MNDMVHVVVVPYHGQGHMNPMLQFAKRLASKGHGAIHVTLATTLSVVQQMQPKLLAVAGGGGGGGGGGGAAFNSITLHSVYDDTEEAQMKLGFLERMDLFKVHAIQNLATFITTTTTPVRCMVYDANLPFCLNVAKQHEIVAAAFATQACASIACYYPLHLEAKGSAAVTLPEVLVLPSAEATDVSNLGWGAEFKVHPVIKMVLEQFENLDQADFVLFNSFDKLEAEVVEWMSSILPVKTVGPTLPSSYLDKRVEGDTDYGFNLYKPCDDDARITSWLDSKPPGSVVYVAFGSVANLSKQQIEEIAEALKQLKNFLWVVRETEESKLPDGFADTSSSSGLVVRWCRQLDVLAHEAVGCFVTHCGWNSTMEALSLGVPMLAMPQFLDQMLDAHFVDQVWGVGIRPKANEKGLVTREEIGQCLGEIMQGERGKKIKENAALWRALAKEAVDEGGSSDKHIDEIIARISS